MTLKPNHWPYIATLLTVLLAGCSTAGGPILGLPIAASKNLKGTVANNTYTSPDKTFSVALPYDESTEHWKYMKVQEGNDGDNLYAVIFGPVLGPSIGNLIVDPHEYHVLYVRNPTKKSFSSTYAETVFKNYNLKVEQKFKKPVEKVAVDELMINNHKAVYGVYKQTFPVGKSRLLKNTRHYVYCLIDLNGHFAFIMAAMAPEGGNQENSREAGLISRQFDRFERLTHSFREEIR